MHAIEITRPGDADVLRMVRRADPAAGAGDVLLRVAAATVNPTDIAQSDGVRTCALAALAAYGARRPVRRGDHLG